MASIAQNSSTEEEHFLQAMRLTMSSALPMVMKVAIELDVFEIIAKEGPDAEMSAESIVSKLSTHNPNAATMLDRILHLLASSSILTSSIATRNDGKVERLYGLASVGKYFVRNEDASSLYPMLLLGQNKVFIDSWYHLKDAIIEGGIPFDKAHGMNLFQYTGIDPGFNHILNDTMSSHSIMLMKKVLETYNGFENLKELVDVGGGIGSIINLIASKYPMIKATNFDLPHVIERAPSYPGVEHVGGDMFASVPSTEAIFMKWILHDWSDGDCISILKNCYKALPDHGKLIVVEAILPVAVEMHTAAEVTCAADVIMMTQSTGGKERTEDELNVLAEGAGFTRMKKMCSVSNLWIMEFYKK